MTMQQKADKITAEITKDPKDFSMASWEHCILGKTFKALRFRFLYTGTPTGMIRHMAAVLDLHEDVAHALVYPDVPQPLLRYIPAENAADMLKAAMANPQMTAATVQSKWATLCGA